MPKTDRRAISGEHISCSWVGALLEDHGSTIAMVVLAIDRAAARAETERSAVVSGGGLGEDDLRARTACEEAARASLTGSAVVLVSVTFSMTSLAARRTAAGRSASFLGPTMSSAFSISSSSAIRRGSQGAGGVLIHAILLSAPLAFRGVAERSRPLVPSDSSEDDFEEGCGEGEVRRRRKTDSSFGVRVGASSLADASLSLLLVSDSAK